MYLERSVPRLRHQVLVVALLLLIAPDVKTSDLFVITGATGVLGRQLARCALNFESSAVMCGYRDSIKAKALHDNLQHSPRAHFLPLDVDLCLSDDHSWNPTLQLHCASAEKVYLFNNAAVCLAGNTLCAIKESLMVNAVSPVQLSLSLIQQLSSLGRGTDIHILNISSGEGESVFLNSGIATELAVISTLDELKDYTAHLIANHDPNFEYAFGETPFYSLSKALLNKGTRLLHNLYFPKARIVSICPGNFISPMSTEEEIPSARSAYSAAESVLEIALDSARFPSGHFYRNGNIIDW